MAALEASKSIPPQEEMILPDEIMAVPVSTGSIVSEREYEVLGGTELLLSNGMQVFFKSTLFQNDEILVTGIAHGGMSEVRGVALCFLDRQQGCRTGLKQTQVECLLFRPD